MEIPEREFVLVDEREPPFEIGFVIDDACFGGIPELKTTTLDLRFTFFLLPKGISAVFRLRHWSWGA